MELQLALDFDFTAEEAMELLEGIAENVDIIEAGTPFLMEEGLSLLKKLKNRFPNKKVLADLKIADAGYREAENAFLAGADIVTVLGAMDDATITNVRDAAKTYKKEVLVDMIGVSDLEKRIRELDAFEVDYICLHTSKDLQKFNTDVSAGFATLKQGVIHAKLALAGGINEESIERYASICPDVIIIGEAITRSKTPKDTVARLRAVMDRVK